MKLQPGFSLMELMVAVAVVAIIAAVAYPSYQGQIRKTKRSEGQTALLDALNRQERFYSTNNTYTLVLSDVGYSASIAVSTAEGNYQISARPCKPITSTCVTSGADEPLTNCIEIIAVAQGNQSTDGDLTIDSRGAKCPTTKW